MKQFVMYLKKNKILIQLIIDLNICMIIAKSKNKNKIIFANVFSKIFFSQNLFCQ